MIDMSIPPYDQKVWAEIYKYVVEWDRNRPKDSPDYTDYQVYNVALAAALLRNAESMEKMTKIMVALTVVIGFLTIVMAFK